MRISPLLAAAAALSFASAASAAPQSRPIGKATVIHNASNGGIRNWQAGPKKSGIIYLQDRTLHWFKVQLTGPCVTNTLQTITFNTDVNGTFDRFSSVSTHDLPGHKCGVTSIRTSRAPPGQPGGPDSKR